MYSYSCSHLVHRSMSLHSHMGSLSNHQYYVHNVRRRILRSKYKYNFPPMLGKILHSNMLFLSIQHPVSHNMIRAIHYNNCIEKHHPKVDR